MKKLMLKSVSLALLLSSSLAASSNGIDYQSLASSDTLTTGDTIPFTPGQNNVYPSLHHIAVARFVGVANAVVQLDITKWAKDKEYELVYSTATTKQKQKFAATKNQVVLKNLKLNQTYSLELITSDATIPFGTFTTAKEEISESLPVAAELFDAIGKFSSDEANADKPIIDYIAQLSSINLYQRLSFVQDYLLNDELLIANPLVDENTVWKITKTQVEDVVLKPTDIDLQDPLGLTNCSCALLTKSYVTITDGYKNYDANRTTSSANTFVKNDNQPDGHYSVFDTQLLGPGKYIGIGLGGRDNKRSYSLTSSTVFGTNQFPHNVTIEYNWLCKKTDGTNAPLCCVKQVDLMYTYNTHLLTALNNGNSKGSYDLAAHAEDYAIIMESNLGMVNKIYRPITAQVIDAGRAFIQAKCSRDFYNGYIDTAATVIKNIVRSALDGSPLDIVNAALDGVVALIKTNTHTTAGSCGTTNLQSTLLPDRTVRLYLLSGIPKKVQMFSAYTVNVETYNNHSQAKDAFCSVLSDFRIASHLPCLDTEDGKCNNYSNNAFMVGGPNNYTGISRKQNYMDQVNSFYVVRNTNHNANWMWGIEDYDCNGNPKYRLSAENETLPEIVESEIAKIEVYSLLGAKLFEGNNTDFATFVKTNGTNNAVYVVRYTDASGKVLKTEKLISNH